MEGIIEGLNREVSDPASQVREGKRFLAELTNLAMEKGWMNRADPRIPLDRVPELIQELRGRNLMIERAARRTEALVREILELKRWAESRGGNVVRRPGELVQSMAIRETVVQSDAGGLRKVRMATVEINFNNPISKLVFHTLYQNGVDVVLIRSNNASGINYFACVNGETKASLKGLMDPTTRDLKLFDGTGYGNQINLGRAEGLDVHELGKKVAQHGTVLEAVHARASEFGLRPGEKVFVSLDPNSPREAPVYQVEARQASAQGPAASRPLGTLSMDGQGALRVASRAQGGSAAGAESPPPERADTRARIASLARATRDRLRRFEVRFRAELGRVAGGPALVQHANFFATVYVFTLVRLMSNEPGLSGDELFAKAAEEAFSPEALTAFGAFLLGAMPLQAASASLSKAGVAAGKQVFRWGGRALGEVAGIVGLFVADGTLNVLVTNADEDSARETRGRLLGALDTERGRYLNGLSERYFDRGGVRVLLEALDPDRMDYALLLAEGAAMVVAGAAAGAVSLNPFLVPAAVLGAATGVRVLVLEFRASRFDPAGLRQEYLGMVQERLVQPGLVGGAVDRVGRIFSSSSDPTRPGGVDAASHQAALEHAQAVSLLVKKASGGLDLFLGKAKEDHAHLEAGYQEIRAALIRAAIYALGDDGMMDERARLHRKVMARDAQLAERLYYAMPRIFRPSVNDSDFGKYIRHGYVHRVVFHGANTGAFQSNVSGWRNVDMLPDLVAQTSSVVREIPNGRSVRDTTTLPAMVRSGELDEAVRILWMQYHRSAEAVRALEDLRVGEDTKVDEMRRSAGQRFPDGFLSVLNVHRTRSDQEVAQQVVVRDEMAGVLGRGFDLAETLAAARTMWAKALEGYYRAAGETPADAPGDRGRSETGAIARGPRRGRGGPAREWDERRLPGRCTRAVAGGPGSYPIARACQ